MKIADKIEVLQNDYFTEWLETRRKVERQLSDGQAMFCVCGRLATGFHESGCRKFHNKVNSETVKQLKHLLEVKK